MFRQCTRSRDHNAVVARRRIGARWAVGALGLLLGTLSCGFADLRPVPFSTVPAEDYAVLKDERSPLLLRFGAEMVRHEAERALSVSSPRGAVEGDLRWKDNDLRFYPAAPWAPGVPYRLSVSSSIRAADGRELRPSVDLTFYAVSRASAPIVRSFHPPDGASVGLEAAEGGYLLLSFSRPMDRRATEAAVSLEGVASPEYLWEDGGRTLRLVPRTRLSPWTVYRWKLGEGARSAEGVPLARVESGSFATDADPTLPAVAGTFTALRSGSSWVDSGSPLSAMDPGCAVGLRFSKPMDEESLGRALRLDPAVSGWVERAADDTFVFVPERNLDGTVAYTVIVSADAADTLGLRLGKEYRETFVPSVPKLSVLSVRADGEGDALPPGPYLVHPVEPDGLLAVDFRFSHPFAGAARAEAPGRVSLEPHFPGTLSSVSLRSARWTTSDTLRLEWVGLEGSGTGIPHYYRLSIPGRRGGIGDGSGLFMGEDYSLYLEVAP